MGRERKRESCLRPAGHAFIGMISAENRPFIGNPDGHPKSQVEIPMATVEIPMATPQKTPTLSGFLEIPMKASPGASGSGRLPVPGWKLRF